MDHKGETGNGRDQYPTENSDEQTVPDVQIVVPSKKPPERQPHEQDDYSRYKDRKEVSIIIEECTYCRQDHRASGYQKQGTQHIGY